jgi:hypothetical protein
MQLIPMRDASRSLTTCYRSPVDSYSNQIAHTSNEINIHFERSISDVKRMLRQLKYCCLRQLRALLRLRVLYRDLYKYNNVYIRRAHVILFMITRY